MNEPTRATIVVEAPASEVLEVITDLEAYPTWARQFQAVEVLERDAARRAVLARFRLDAGLLKDTFTLRYAYSTLGTGHVVAWHLVDAGQLEALDGAYTIETTSPRQCTVEYRLFVDPGLPVITALRRKAENVVITTALQDLAARVAAVG